MAKAEQQAVQAGLLLGLMEAVTNHGLDRLRTRTLQNAVSTPVLPFMLPRVILHRLNYFVYYSN